MKLAKSKVHFIGIGGIGMCGLAELLHNMGAQVTGSDLRSNQQVEHLKTLGIDVAIGHATENVTADMDVVVYSSAVRFNNEEFQQAKKLSIPLIPRAEALAEIMRMKRGIAVAGTHGKTTTTSLTASIFLEANFDPTIVVGGRLDVIKSTAQLGKGEWLIAEADESDGSFSKLSPEMAIVTNIDNDHMDHYKNFHALEGAFYDFACRIPFYGCLIACGDDLNIREVYRDFSKKIIYYGFSENNDYRLSGELGNYKVYENSNFLGELIVPIPGKHNALNALAAVICAMQAGVEFAAASRAIENFQGVDRRFQKKAIKDGVSFYDDYGHHPTEIKAVVSAFKEKFPDRPLKVVFQPHRYTRTEACWDDFLKCFEGCDKLFLMDIYPAGEAEIPGIHAKKLAESILGVDIEYLPATQIEQVDIKKISDQLKEGDLLLTLGAGNIWKIGEAIYAGVKL